MSYTDPRPTAVCDSECFIDYWSIGFQNVETKQIAKYEFYEGHPLDRPKIASILRKYRIVTFNGNRYDVPMIVQAMQPGVTNADLKRLSDDLIVGGLTPWRFYERSGLSVPDFIDHIDLIEVNPGAPTKPSLKLCGGRMHSRRLQDLPFDPSESIDAEKRVTMNIYLPNDLETTADLYFEVKPQLDLRAVMSEQYGLDLRSKSDAQIAEAVIKSEVERITKRRIYRPDIRPGTFRYDPPSFIRFDDPGMQQVFRELCEAEFTIRDDGVVVAPKTFDGRVVTIAGTAYTMGIGGLHSRETGVSHVADDKHLILDRDVASYYPSIILATGLTPPQIGPVFREIYSSIKSRRVIAKNEGKRLKKLDPAAARDQDNIAESLKTVINGTFGKLGSPYSMLYAPKLLIQTTVGGQLMILMLIERLEANGITVISANTDGIVSKVPVAKRDLFEALIFDWEVETSLVTEETAYAGLYSRDVNNYVAVKPGGEVKTKGVFAPCGRGQKGAAGMRKNPAAEIAAHAAVQLIVGGTPVEQTIGECQDIRKFLVVRRVTGGAQRDGEVIGKTLRWYYGTRKAGPLRYALNDKVVGRSEGAEVMLELPEDYACPADLDRAWYVREAYAILQDIGYGAIDPSLRGRTGLFLGRLPDAKNIHTIDASTGLSLCGVATKSIREPWVEFQVVPTGHRRCPKCLKASEL